MVKKKLIIHDGLPGFWNDFKFINRNTLLMFGFLHFEIVDMRAYLYLFHFNVDKVNLY